MSAIAPSEKSPYVIRIDASRATLWNQRSPLLTHLDMEITARCNLNCIHCYINRPSSDRAAAKSELSTAEIKDLLKAAAALGCLTVRFTGGEPLLRGDFEALYLTARKLGMKVGLLTNATLLSSRLTALLIAIPPLEPLEITLYGMTAASFEAVTRTSGSFKSAWRGIHRLDAEKIPFSLRFAILPPNREEIEAFENWAAGLSMLTDAPSYAMIFNLRGRRDSDSKNAAIKSFRLPPETATAILARNSDRYRNNLRDFCSRYMGPTSGRLFSCGAGRGAAAVSADGFLQPCLLVRHPETVYDLRTGPLTEGFTRLFPDLRKMEASDPEYIRRCGRCFLRGLCEQCPAHSWTEHGALDKPVDYLCQVAHAQARHLGLIFENEWAWTVCDWRKRLEDALPKVARR